MAYYGTDYMETELEKELDVSEKYGTATKSIVAFFKKRGFKIYEGNMNFEILKKYIDRKIPVMILIQAWAERKTNYIKTNNWGHYVVVCGYTNSGFILEDPAIFGKGFLSYTQLTKRWHAIDNKILNNYGIAVWGKKIYNYKKLLKIK